MQHLKHNGYHKTRGKLKLFFGYAAGVGKTYAMLEEAHELKLEGIDVVLGYVEPHARPDTQALQKGLEHIPAKEVIYKGIRIHEFDLDAALQRQPQLIIVDELAHTNAHGSRNNKRFQDVEELLNAGIHVYTTINVQHIESLRDDIERIIQVRIHETIPDSVFDQATTIKLVDIDPHELLERFYEGKIYHENRVETATKNFFTVENLIALREISLRRITTVIRKDKEAIIPTTSQMGGMKFLICISSSPNCGEMIRWASQAAGAFFAEWSAVYVETEEDEGGNGIVQQHAKLIEKLGGNLAILKGESAVKLIAEYAKQIGVTNVVVGKSRNKKTILTLFRPEFEDQLIELIPNIEVHIIPGSNHVRQYTSMQKKKHHKHIHIDKKDLGITFLTLFLATGGSLLLRDYDLQSENFLMVYLLSIVIVSLQTQGYIYGALASLISVFSFNFFLAYPYYNIMVNQKNYPITFLMFMSVALITSFLTNKLKKEAREATEKEMLTNVLYEINQKLLTTRGLINIKNLVNEYLSKITNQSIVFYTMNEDNQFDVSFKQMHSSDDMEGLLGSEEKAVASWSYYNKKQAGVSTDTLSGAQAFYLPLVSNEKTLGVIGVLCTKETMKHEQKNLIKRISDHIVMALIRQQLSDEQKKILVESEKEKMRANLLRAISHDIRTPLTGILGASSTLLDGGEEMELFQQKKFVENIHAEALWLIRMVENLLIVTRMNTGKTSIVKKDEAAEEVISDVVHRIKRQYPKMHIDVRVPNDLLIIPMDAMLIAQVLTNVLENAIKHSSNIGTVEINLKKNDQVAVFEVIDYGKGIPKDKLDTMFEGQQMDEDESVDGVRGMGIGLSLCKTIVHAHYGEIWAYNSPTHGGGVVSFSLPLNNRQEKRT